MPSRVAEIKSAMSLKKAKNAEYPDATPAVHLALQQVRSQCESYAQSLAEKVGGDEETQEAFSSMCVRNGVMLSPLLNQSYFVRKEVLQWDCRQ